jgi:hypothetical protein
VKTARWDGFKDLLHGEIGQKEFIAVRVSELLRVRHFLVST